VRCSPDFQPRPLKKAGVADALAQRYPGKAFLVWTVAGSGKGIASRVASWKTGTLARLAGTSLGAESSALLLSGPLKIMRMVDGKHVPVTLEAKD
jgi:hypothetical protein